MPRGSLSRRKLLRAAAAGGASLGLAGIAAACRPTTAPTPGPTAPVGAPTAEPTPGISTEQLNVVARAEVTGLDVHVRSREVLDMIHDSLLSRDLTTMDVRPHLATSWRAVDPTTWEFKLRRGVTFHNGEPFNAQTVKFNFDRVIEPDLRSAYGASIRGFLDGVEVVDDDTVLIHTQFPYGLLLERLLTIRMVPERYYAENSFEHVANNPVGSGPYKFVEWVTGQRVVVERNDDYWGPGPAFQRVVVRTIIEPATAMAELLSGSAHVVYDIAPDQVEEVTRSGIADIRSTPNVQCLEIRLDSLPRGDPNPFTDKRVRHAASYAIDKEAIASNLMGGYSQVQATNIGPMMFGHDPTVLPYPHDPDRARQLLAEAGYADGFEARFGAPTVSGFPTARAVAEAVANDLAQVGIRAQLNTLSSQEHRTLVREGRAGPMFIGANQNGGFFEGGFGFFYLRERFTSSYYYTDELEEQIIEIESATDPEVRKGLLSDVQHLLREEAPYIWGWSGHDLHAVDSRIDLEAYPDFMRLSLAKPKGT